MSNGARTGLAMMAAVVLAFGCATLRVDVDVYKGPLANSEEVQIEQMASMAMGARPLLIELRDRLEAGTDGAALQRWRESLGKEYNHGYIEVDSRRQERPNRT